MYVLATISLAACGDDDPTGPGDALTDTEVAALVEALFTTAVDPSLPDGGASSGPAAAASVSFPIDETVTCSLGGSIRMRGSVKVTLGGNDDSGTYEHQIEQVHQNCVVQVAGVTGSFRFAGAPAIVSTVEAEIENGLVTDFEGAENGTVRWTLGDREGRCQVDLDYVISPTLPANPSYRVTGQVCGRSVDRVIAVES